MASTNKTTYLNLNQWVGSDKPKMADFNTDNQRIDTGVSALNSSMLSHINSALVHLTTADKEKIASVLKFEIRTYAGDGVNQRKITLGYKPKLGLIFAVDKPMFEKHSPDNSFNQNSAAFTELGCSEGITLENDGIRLYYSSFNKPDGNGLRINAPNVTYILIAAR